MDVRHPFSRRRFFGGVAAAVGALGIDPKFSFGQVRTEQFTGGEAQYDAYVKIASNENNWGPPPAVMEAMQHGFKYANRYGNPDGNIMQAIAEHHGVKRENVLLTAGSGEVLDVVGTTYLQNGKVVLGADPSYGSVYQHATTIKSDAIKLPLLKDFRQDIPGMIAAANRNARDIGFFYLCNPNNPTGVVVSAKEVRQVVEGLPKDMPILIDEAYHHFVDDPAYSTSVPYVIEGRQVIVARTFSKIAALAGMRLGYAIATRDLLAPMRAHMTGSVNAVVRWGGVAALKDTARQEWVKRQTIELREKSRRELKAFGYETIPSDANFFMVHLKRPVVPVIDEFRKRGVLVGRPFPPLNESLRVSIGTPEEMQRFHAAFREIMKA